MARQYTGSAGKITNCQIGVFATYASRHGHAFIDRALYLPKSWTDDPLRLDADELNEANYGLWTRGLLLRRNIEDGELAYFTTWCPAGTVIETLVNVEGRRWSIEDSFETAKNESGLDHNETRSWHGWHRHVSLVMMAFAMMAAIRHQANQATSKKTSAKTGRAHPLVDPGNPPNSATAQAAPH